MKPINTSLLAKVFIPIGLFLKTMTTLSSVDGQTFNLVPHVRSPQMPVIFERFKKDSCAIAENSVGNELSPINPNRRRAHRRKLLRFSVVIENQGPDDVRVGEPTSCDEEEDSCIWEWGECHGHHHFINFTHYELLDSNDKTQVVGRKQAFCLMDIEDMGGNGGQSRGHYTCHNQGISAGWADVYGHWLEGQWLDVTKVRPGNYTLCVQVDYGNFFAETNEDDNKVCQPVMIPRRVGKARRRGRAHHCRPEGGRCEAGGDSECCHGSCVENNNRHRCDSGLHCLSESMRCKRHRQCCEGMKCRRQERRGPKVCR